MYVFSIILQIFMLSSPQVPVKGKTLPKMLPAYKTHNIYKDSASQLNQFKMDHPEIYGITVAPPSGFRLYPEFHAVDAIYLVYEDYLQDYYISLIGAAADVIDVYVLVSGSAMQSQIDNILTANLTAAQMAKVHYIDLYDTAHYVFQNPSSDTAIDSIWMVDYGPFFLQDATGQTVITDPHYYPERINDDAIPTKLGNILDMDVYRVDLNMEGGNLLSDGLGNCYSTAMLLQENSDLAQNEVESILYNYYGCENVIWLTPLKNEGTGHIDMFFILPSEDTVIVAEYTSGQDSENKTILDDNASILENTLNGDNQPLNVLRIPMPDPATDSYGYRIWRTYTNGLRINDTYLVPVYTQNTTYEAAALNVITSALPPSVNVVTVPSDSIIEWAGAIHCTTRTKPVGTAYKSATVPDYLCDGKPVCDDCTDECDSEGSVGCTDDGDRYLCARTGEDTCLHQVVVPCPADAQCSDGMCGDQNCTDECTPGEIGCDGSGTQWVCGEAGDDDSCFDKIKTDCGNGLTCQNGSCVPADGSCGNFDFTGTCQGNISIYCDNNNLVTVNCEDMGGVCGWSDGDGYYDCLYPSDCTNDCIPTEKQCGENGTVMICSETFDGDFCYDWKEGNQCGDEETCENGECVSVCTDECQPDDSGCEDATSVFTCEMGSSGCYEKVVTQCSENETCTAGACSPADNSSDSSDSGCSCSAAGQTSNSPAPFIPAFFLFVFGFIYRKKFM